MPTTSSQQLKKALMEMYEYWRTRSAKGGIANPSVVAGVLLTVIDKVNVLWPKEEQARVVVRKVLKRRVY